MLQTLARDEAMVAEIQIPSSPFTKSHYHLTDRRLIAETTKTFLGLVPVGKSHSTYPLNNIASVNLETRFRLWMCLFGVLIVVYSLSNIGKGAIGTGILGLLVGLLLLFLAFPGAFVVANNAGQRMEHVVWVTGRQAAQNFVHQVNRIIAERR